MGKAYQRHVERFANGEEIDFGPFFGGDADKEYQQFYKPAVDRVAQLEGRRIGLEQGGRLTAVGVKEKLAVTFAELAKEGRRDRAEIERQIAAARERADSIAMRAVPKLEPADAVGELRDQELRRWYLAQDAETRQNLLAQMGAGEHPGLAVALLRGEPVIVGMVHERREQLRDVLLSPKDHEQLELVRAAEKRLEAALGANLAADQALRRHAGLTGSEARQLLGLPQARNLEEFKAQNGLAPLASINQEDPAPAATPKPAEPFAEVGSLARAWKEAARESKADIAAGAASADGGGNE